MAHYGRLGDYRFSSDVDDVRGANLYGTNDDKLGKIDDVIFDHATGTIQYVVVDTGGWLITKKFLVPADRIRPYAKDEDDFVIDATKQQIEALPKYDEDAMKSEADWSSHHNRYREAWGSGPVLHREGSIHSITPEASQMPAADGSGLGDEALTPTRIAGKFPETANDANKLRMRPASAVRSEDSRLPGAFVPQEKPTLASEEAEERAAQRDHLIDPDQVYRSEQQRNPRWTAFEDLLRRNRVDVTATCRSCGTARDRVA